MRHRKYKESELGLIWENWSIVQLSEVAEIVSGGTPSTKKEEYYGDEISWITPKDLSGYDKKYISKGERSITKAGLDNSSAKLLPKDTILFSSRAPIGYVAIAKNQLSTNQGFKNLICDTQKVDIQFMYYKMKSLKNELELIAGGSTFKEVSGKVLKEFKIKLPSLLEQKKIGEILSSLDKKIELNNEMNKTLEEMAQALFKRWFVDFEFLNEEGKHYKSSGGEMVESELGMIPKAWKVKNLEDISTVTMGVSPSSNSYNEDKVGLPLLNGAADFEGKLIKPSKYTSEPKKVCKCGDMIFGVRATIGNTVFADKEYALGRGVASVSPKNYIFREFIYFCLNSSMNKLINSASGSVFLNLKKADITDLKLCYSEVVINKFNKIAKELINKVIENDIESEILKQQRDSLLPKLMSGEIRVDNVETDI